MVFGPGSICGLAPSEYADTLDPSRKIKARRDLNLKDDDLILLYIGRPHKHKGFPVAIEAFGRLFAADESVKLLICGCNPADVKRFWPDPAPGIRALGYVNDLHPIYRAADAVLLPSLYEGLPYSLLEGAAQGCAMIASRIPGPDALIEEGKNGLFIMPGNVDDLVRALNQIDRNRNGLHAMGMAAYDKALEFRRERVVGPYLAFMRGIVAAADSRFRRDKASDRLAA
jgi:glycosyltransferase involved in cell wall biosynthesis